jgi:hypothetical protein
MANLPSRRRVWAIAYGLALAVAAPVLLVQQVSSTPLAGQREGVIHLKRGQDTVDVDSLLDSNQPDFFLRIEMDKPSPAPSPAVEDKPSDATPAEAVATPTMPSDPTPFPAQPLDPEANVPPMEATDPPAVPGPAISERLQIVADALYHAPRLAREGRYRQALEVVDAALGVDDEVAHLHALRGSICFKLGRERQAEESWERALALDPRLTDARDALIWIRNRRR